MWRTPKDLRIAAWVGLSPKDARDNVFDRALNEADVTGPSHGDSQRDPNALSPRKLINVDELSALWSVPKATLYNWVNQGRLPYVKLGRSLRFDVVEIEALRQQSTMGLAGRR
jgi:excisionase family DNA binding protein